MREESREKLNAAIKRGRFKICLRDSMKAVEVKCISVNQPTADQLDADEQ